MTRIQNHEKSERDGTQVPGKSPFIPRKVMNIPPSLAYIFLSLFLSFICIPLCPLEERCRSVSKASFSTLFDPSVGDKLPEFFPRNGLGAVAYYHVSYILYYLLFHYFKFYMYVLAL
jgi:hypothetical protein